jgi:hypothetical protein
VAQVAFATLGSGFANFENCSHRQDEELSLLRAQIPSSFSVVIKQAKPMPLPRQDGALELPHTAVDEVIDVGIKRRPFGEPDVIGSEVD